VAMSLPSTAWGGCLGSPCTTISRVRSLSARGGHPFQPDPAGLAGHYRFEPRPVAVARGNEKGRVERAIRYIRDAFFAGRRFTDVDDLNAQADAWVIGPAGERRCPEDETLTVSEAFAQERTRLLELPGESPFRPMRSRPSRPARRPMCASTSMTIRSRIPAYRGH
jgi:hypothetical protein